MTKIAQLKPIDPKLKTLPKREQCLEPGKAEYSVEELEMANKCLAKQLLQTRKRFFDLVKVNDTREKVTSEAAANVPSQDSTTGSK